LFSSKTKTVVFSGVFIALTVILTHIFAIQTPFLRISFGFLPIAVFAMLFGPWKTGLMAAIADILGGMIFSPGLFFPGFTVSAFLSGLIYGYFFYKKEITIKILFIASTLILLFIDLGLNTIWLSMLYNKAAEALIVSRAIKSLLMLPLHIFLLYMVHKPLLLYYKPIK